MLAKRLGCKIDELEDRGVLVMSAGIAADDGRKGQPPRRSRSCPTWGSTLADTKRSRLTEPLARHADVIYTMTRSHREAIVAQWPSAAERTEVLAADGADICDPIGGPVERYRCCAAKIRAELETRMNELELSPTRIREPPTLIPRPLISNPSSLPCESPLEPTIAVLPSA